MMAIGLALAATALVTAPQAPPESAMRGQDPSPASTPGLSPTQPAQAQPVTTPKPYHNTRYHYSFSYPSGKINSLVRTKSPEVSEAVSLSTDSASIPMRVCAGDNLGALSARQLFEKSTTIDPVSPNAPLLLCSTPQKYVRSVTEDLINKVPAYRVKIWTHDHTELCWYLSTPSLLLSICIPEEDPANPSWQRQFEAYKQILATLTFSRDGSSPKFQ